MRNISYFLVFIGLLLSSFQYSSPDSDDFDAGAKEFFLRNFNQFDLRPLSTSEKCILKQTVSNDLKAINNWRVVLFYDSLMLKMYWDPYLRLPFTFVKDRASNQFQFLWVPFLRNYLYDMDLYYKAVNDSMYVFKKPISAIKLPCQLLDDFFDGPAFRVSNEESFYKKQTIAENLMSEVLPTIFLNEIPVPSFQTKMEQMLAKGDISKSNFDIIKREFVDPMFNISHYRIKTFYLKRIGYVILAFRVVQTGQLKVDVYFISEKFRPWESRLSTTDYRECFDN